jgi:hypothetical protein
MTNTVIPDELDHLSPQAREQVLMPTSYDTCDSDLVLFMRIRRTIALKRLERRRAKRKQWRPINPIVRKPSYRGI